MQEIPLMPMANQNPNPMELDKVLENQLSQVPVTDLNSGNKISPKIIIIIVASLLVLGGIGFYVYSYMTKAPADVDPNSIPPTIDNPFAVEDETTQNTTTVNPDETPATPDTPPSLELPANPPSDTPADTTKTDLQTEVDTLETAANSAANVTTEPTVTDEPSPPKKIPRR